VEKSLESAALGGRKEQGRECYQHVATSKANVPDKEVTHMLCYEQYGDSTPEIKKQYWKYSE
jgi:hypothetical protein